MELLYTQEEIHRLEVYGEYLKKIPDLLKQLETIEKMYQKAVMEEEMIAQDVSLAKPLRNGGIVWNLVKEYYRQEKQRECHRKNWQN